MNKLFDLRVVIALLFLIFGVVVTVSGLVANSAVSASGDPVGVNVNLWTGIPMLIFAVLMGLWAFLRPVQPDAPAPVEDEPAAK
jgi:Na+/proline symporter